MNFLFGKKKSSPPAPSKAIDKLRNTLETLEKRETFLDKQITILKDKAVQEKNKSKALTYLKKAKLWEKELESIFGQKFNLETQISALTQAITNSETIQAMRMGRETLAGLEAKLDPDNVADIMDDLSENIARIGEVSDAMGRPIGPVIDDDELLLELNEMILEKENITEPDLTNLPQVSNKEFPTEEEEIRQIEALMNA